VSKLEFSTVEIPLAEHRGIKPKANWISLAAFTQLRLLRGCWVTFLLNTRLTPPNYWRLARSLSS